MSWLYSIVNLVGKWTTENFYEIESTMKRLAAGAGVLVLIALLFNLIITYPDAVLIILLAFAFVIGMLIVGFD